VLCSSDDEDGGPVVPEQGTVASPARPGSGSHWMHAMEDAGQGGGDAGLHTGPPSRQFAVSACASCWSRTVVLDRLILCEPRRGGASMQSQACLTLIAHLWHDTTSRPPIPRACAACSRRMVGARPLRWLQTT
jgi:hypothetical protein